MMLSQDRLDELASGGLSHAARETSDRIEAINASHVRNASKARYLQHLEDIQEQAKLQEEREV